MAAQDTPMMMDTSSNSTTSTTTANTSNVVQVPVLIPVASATPTLLPPFGPPNQPYPNQPYPDLMTNTTNNSAPQPPQLPPAPLFLPPITPPTSTFKKLSTSPPQAPKKSKRASLIPDDDDDGDEDQDVVGKKKPRKSTSTSSSNNTTNRKRKRNSIFAKATDSDVEEWEQERRNLGLHNKNNDDVAIIKKPAKKKAKKGSHKKKAAVSDDDSDGESDYSPQDEDEDEDDDDDVIDEDDDKKSAKLTKKSSTKQPFKSNLIKNSKPKLKSKQQQPKRPLPKPASLSSSQQLQNQANYKSSARYKLPSNVCTGQLTLDKKVEAEIAWKLEDKKQEPILIGEYALMISGLRRGLLVQVQDLLVQVEYPAWVADKPGIVGRATFAVLMPKRLSSTRLDVPPTDAAYLAAQKWSNVTGCSLADYPFTIGPKGPRKFRGLPCKIANVMYRVTIVGICKPDVLKQFGSGLQDGGDSPIEWVGIPTDLNPAYKRKHDFGANLLLRIGNWGSVNDLRVDDRRLDDLVDQGLGFTAQHDWDRYQASLNSGNSTTNSSATNSSSSNSTNSTSGTIDPMVIDDDVGTNNSSSANKSASSTVNGAGPSGDERGWDFLSLGGGDTSSSSSSSTSSGKAAAPSSKKPKSSKTEWHWLFEEDDGNGGTKKTRCDKTADEALEKAYAAQVGVATYKILVNGHHVTYTAVLRDPNGPLAKPYQTNLTTQNTRFLAREQIPVEEPEEQLMPVPAEEIKRVVVTEDVLGFKSGYFDKLPKAVWDKFVQEGFKPFLHKIDATDPLVRPLVEHFKTTLNKHNEQSGSDPGWIKNGGPGTGVPDIQDVWLVINPWAYAKFEAHKVQMAAMELQRSTRSSSGGYASTNLATTDVALNVRRNLFHGTAKLNIDSIVFRGLDPMLGTNSSYGRGAYWALHASYSSNGNYQGCSDYPGVSGSGSDWNKAALRHVFIGDVLVGRMFNGRVNISQPDPLYGTGIGASLDRYDTAVDNIGNPQIFCCFRPEQMLIKALVSFYVK